MLYIPLFVLAIVLIGFVIYNVTRINLRNTGFSHSVYYLLGASKKTCRRISLYSLLINVALSIIMFVGEVFIYAKLASKYNLNFHLGIDTYLIAGRVYVLLIVYSVLVSCLMTRGMSPVDLMRKSKTAI
ncbi:MAG: hypothetical protein J6M24_02595 [Lachnospiraceae bacterium]|nr:hypothetical protein [Lachnospiraceae bacterium]